jgi:hypothetical protein
MQPQGPATVVFTDTEMQLLDQADPKPSAAPRKRTITRYLYVVARLGGYLSRTHDTPPGNTVLWRGFTRLMDMHFGYRIAARLVGN